MSTVARAEAASSARVWEGELPALDERTREILSHRRSTLLPRRRRSLVRRALVAADASGLVLAFLVAAAMFGSYGDVDRVALWTEFVVFFASIPAWLLLANLHGLYDRDETRADHSTVDDLFSVFQFVTVGAWVFLLGSWITGLADPVPLKLASFWALAIGLVTFNRAFARGWCRRSLAYLQNTLIVGAGDVGQLIARKLSKHPEYGLNLVGFVDDDPKERRGDLDHLSVIGSPEDLPALIELLDVERVVISFSNESAERTLELVRSLRPLDVQVDVVPRLFEALGPKINVHTVEGLPLFGLPPARLAFHARVVKRTVDLVGAAVALVLAAPLFAVVAWRIKRDSPGPVFFRQTRLGQDMREFTLLKFRTMREDTDDAEHREYIRRTTAPGPGPAENGVFKLDRSAAVTRVGRWLRRTSLDELPQLVNVLRGELSLVGPRPCIPYETETFKPHQFERFLVPQGITGLWQVTARANATFGEALDMDVAYVRGWSLGLDLRLLLRTPFVLLRQREATS